MTDGEQRRRPAPRDPYAHAIAIWPEDRSVWLQESDGTWVRIRMPPAEMVRRQTEAQEHGQDQGRER